MRRKIGIGWYEKLSPIMGVETLGYNLFPTEINSLPSVVGRWMIEEIEKRGIDAFLEKIKAAQGDLVWYRIGRCPFCGKENLPRPEGVEAVIAGYGVENKVFLKKSVEDREWEMIVAAERAKELCGFPDPDLVMHKHSETAASDPFQSPNEVIYLVGKDGMEIWVKKKDDPRWNYRYRGMDEGYDLKWIERPGAGAKDWELMDEAVGRKV